MPRTHGRTLIGHSDNKILGFFPTDVGSNLFCVHRVAQSCHRQERSDVNQFGEKIHAFSDSWFSDHFLLFSLCLWVCICSSVRASKLRVTLISHCVLVRSLLFFRSLFTGLAVLQCVLLLRSEQPMLRIRAPRRVRAVRGLGVGVLTLTQVQSMNRVGRSSWTKNWLLQRDQF
ncbi:hypothetical protein AB205_0175930, partial [Aquarana catesbeiana]